MASYTISRSQCHQLDSFSTSMNMRAWTQLACVPFRPVAPGCSFSFSLMCTLAAHRTINKESSKVQISDLSPLHSIKRSDALHSRPCKRRTMWTIRTSRSYNIFNCFSFSIRMLNVLAMPDVVSWWDIPAIAVDSRRVSPLSQTAPWQIALFY
jgi:hypothetical protein